MNIAFFSHPQFLGSQSMPRFVNMLVRGMKKRGHSVQVFCPEPYLFRIPLPHSLRKYLGYVDQYFIFPMTVRSRIKRCPHDTLFVLTDHALGPWFPMVRDHPHVIHCHDFLAQRSALQRIPEHETGWLGRRYQAFIHDGYSKAQHFISVSYQTRDDLHTFLPGIPLHSEVVYNGMNQGFQPCHPGISRRLLSDATGFALNDGYLLHVGGNQWYKNRVGVIELYNAWRRCQKKTLPLVMIGRKPDKELRRACERSPFRKDIFFVVDLSDKMLPFAYAGATVFVFPSLAEGFGWPIAEAMAAGCPVITSNAAPMTEVAGDAAFLIPLRPNDRQKVEAWALDAATAIRHVIDLEPEERVRTIEAGLLNAKRFDPEVALDRIEAVYREVCAGSFMKKPGTVATFEETSIC